MRLIAGVMAFCLLAATPGSADMLMLVTGESFTGRFANRNVVRDRPAAQAHISLLLADSDEELLRFELGQIDYLVFEDGEEREVVDLSSLKPGRPPGAAQRGSPEYRRFRESLEPKPERSKKGIALIAGGLMTGAFGALIKFGDEKLTITEGSMDHQESSYNALNYFLMVGGGAMCVIGITIQVSDSTPSASNHAMLTVESCVTPLSRMPGVGVSLSF